jgi:hypothetical protein
MTEREQVIQNYVNSHKKSQAAAFFLALLLGPLGLFYCSWVAALILSVIFVTGFATIVIPVFCWLIAFVISAGRVTAYNNKVRAEAELLYSGNR